MMSTTFLYFLLTISKSCNCSVESPFSLPIIIIPLGFVMRILKLYITIEKYTIFQLKSIPVLIVCEDKKSYLNAG